MNLSGAQNFAKQYSQIGTTTQAEAASPHMLILMLLNGAIDKISAARGFLERGHVEQKGRHIFWAVSIVAGLRSCLDLEKGGEIAENLQRLYDYIERRLMEANTRNDPALLDEVVGLLRTVKEGWEGIPAEFHHFQQP